MKRWLRRTVYALLVLLWLLVMSLPLTAVTVARRGQVQLGRADRSNVRIFLVQEQSANGIGMAFTRGQAEANSCQHTSVIYLMWEGEGQRSRFCQCFGDDGHVTGATCD